jgi:hypothetical protein
MSKCCESHEEQHSGCDCGCGKNACGCSCHCDCGCDCHSFQRRYETKAEKISELEGYLSELHKEVQAVEEMLADLRK